MLGDLFLKMLKMKELEDDSIKDIVTLSVISGINVIQVWTIRINSSGIGITQGYVPSPDAYIAVDANVLSSIIMGYGDVTTKKAIVTGGIRMGGNAGIAMNLLKKYLILDGCMADNLNEQSGITSNIYLSVPASGGEKNLTAAE